MRKTSKTLVAAIIVVVTVAAFVVGCKKEQEMAKDSVSASSEMDSDGNSAVQRIVAFKKQVDEYKTHLGMKTADAVSISEAVADIVELFNAVYAQPEYFYVQTVRNSFTINLPLTSEGKVLVNDVVSVYNQAIVLARQAYINDGINTNKGYVGLMVQLGNITDDTAELVFYSTSGQSGDFVAPSTGYNGPFDEDDDWLYKAPMGKCDGTPGSGADEQIEMMIKSICYDWGRDPVTGQRYYYYGYEHRDFLGCVYPDFLYFNSNIDGICIEDDQMNSLYYSEMEFVKNYGPSQEGLPMTGSNRYYLRNFTIRGNETPMYEGFCSHNISADYAHRTLNWPVVIEPGNLLDD